ncbi:phage major capsid protein [Kordiimonas marina]|uniref:phage major capsid protein n=1 Tax=Kordiimonas marina TaxID=2872312 RepID=UPI001FF397CE|nr:phage major capsid protein [Kordiimonas marina]MCJ9428683.1 phage major capsid protein [Kordiimonas marina]
MDMTDLKSAIDDYSSTAEQCILGFKDRLDAIETKMARPGAASDQFSSSDAEHKSAFLQGFIQKGNTDRLKALEAKGLTTVPGSDGSYAVPTVIDTEIEKQLRVLSPMRKLVKVKTIETSDYKRLVNIGGTGSGWVGETGTRVDTNTPTLKHVTITPGEIYANAAATQRALDDMQFDAEAWLNEEVAEEFAVQEGSAIVNGDGVNKPTGFLTHTPSALADGARTFGDIQYVPTGTDGAFDATSPADVLVDLVHTLNPRYRQGATFVMNSKTLALVRKFKDTNGNFIWMPGLAAGQPDMLLGYPVAEVEDMPDVASGSLSVAFGNFERAYTLVERTGTRVLRDPYTDKPNVHFYATRRVGGELVNDAALKLLQFSIA